MWSPPLNFYGIFELCSTIITILNMIYLIASLSSPAQEHGTTFAHFNLHRMGHSCLMVEIKNKTSTHRTSHWSWSQTAERQSRDWLNDTGYPVEAWEGLRGREPALHHNLEISPRKLSVLYLNGTWCFQAGVLEPSPLSTVCLTDGMFWGKGLALCFALFNVQVFRTGLGTEGPRS